MFNIFKRKKDQRPDAPQYCWDIFDTLRRRGYEIHYYVETCEDIMIDCFIIDGFLIKLDRVPVDTLSHKDFYSLIDEIEKLLDTMREIMINWGWKLQ